MTRFAGLSLKNPVHFLALGGGLGLAPKAPGTFGTLAAFPFYFLMQDWGLFPYLMTLILFSAAGIYICGKAAKDMGEHDHPAIVWDEVVGMLITLIAAPAGWIWLIIGFALFRLFDIWKPWPIRFFDKQVDGGLGIMVDDIIAGIFALVWLQALARVFPGL
ncbi:MULTISPECIES: phosphatidylglycerophosphatase A [Ferrimonas]|uniref:phosphatidylglycerophosphatase A family protein n=1 Tax=Ferrimonas TaxID=44011 RepID=UPI00041B8380|nr:MULTISPECIES: phosphatidylglycerophosphatase A [Ferrimonas]USD38511.1 phosphatidylglycerophosphatase A [Ferrimonas sp. SCSIO 43195]